jgi:hypothetical protein
VGRGLGVGVTVPVDVAVAVAVGVGVGDPPLTASNMSTRPHPYTLFGGPAVPHCVEEINTAELFKALRLSGTERPSYNQMTARDVILFMAVYRRARSHQKLAVGEAVSFPYKTVSNLATAAAAERDEASAWAQASAWASAWALA